MLSQGVWVVFFFFKTWVHWPHTHLSTDPKPGIGKLLKHSTVAPVQTQGKYVLPLFSIDLKWYHCMTARMERNKWKGRKLFSPTALKAALQRSLLEAG